MDESIPRASTEDRSALLWGYAAVERTAMTFEELFRSAEPARDKFLSRLFGLFSEEVVRTWCSAPTAPYVDLGRPTLLAAGEQRGFTLDFTFQDRADERLFVGELKAELEFEGYKYLRLATPGQLDHHRGAPFQRFLEMARNPSAYTVRVHEKTREVAGAVLVWGAVEPAARPTIIAAAGVHDVLSVEDMLSDLRRWGSTTDWAAKVAALRRWSLELLDRLI
jgi:hypothetical protein